jgi:hypothetical protein
MKSIFGELSGVPLYEFFEESLYICSTILILRSYLCLSMSFVGLFSEEESSSDILNSSVADSNKSSLVVFIV